MTKAELDTSLGFSTAPFFRERETRRKAFLQTVGVRSNESWQRVDDYGKNHNREGDYSGNGFGIKGEYPHQFLPESHYTHRRNGEQLDCYVKGIDSFIADRIRKVLALKKDVPVVALDIGGMVGVSWSRLARLFEQEVEEGRVVLVVSNLAYDPDQDLAKEILGKVNRTIVNEARGLAHYIVADPSRLTETQVQLPDGSSLPLAGNVDVAFERFSLHYWSFVPEAEIPQVASLLSRYATYVVNGGDNPIGFHSTLHLNPGQFEQHRMEEEARIAAIGIAHEEIQRRFGLRKVTHVESGELAGKELNGWNDHFFLKADAPSLEVNKQPEVQIVSYPNPFPPPTPRPLWDLY